MSAPRRPSNRPPSRSASRPSLARRLAGGGVGALASGYRACARRPWKAGGVGGFLALFAAITLNAFFWQPGRHPKPLLATRAAESGLASRESVLSNDGSLMAVPLVREMQIQLAATGHYQAVVDGKPGRATEAAIKAFQTEMGLRVDGQPSPSLLTQIQRVASAPPSPQPKPSEAERHASLEERMGGDETGAVADRGLKTEAADVADIPPAELVRRIQSALNSARVAELEADGIAGERTRAAIRTFEALEGLDVTGSPDARILERLIEIGAAR